MYRDKSSFLSLNKTTAAPAPPTPATTLSGMDMEEMRDYISRREMEYALLEQSVSEFAVQCDERINSIIKERDAALSKCGQLEILLKGRQSALIAKEEEIQRLKTREHSRRVFSLCRNVSPILISASPPSLTHAIPQTRPLSIISTVPHISVFPVFESTRKDDRRHLVMVFSDAIRIEPHITLDIVPASPPRTVYHHKGYSNRLLIQPSPQRSLFMSTESIQRNLGTPEDDDDSSDGFSRPLGRPISRLGVSTSSMQSAKSFDMKYRESFSSIRSAVSFVHSSDDDSDASLDELVTSTLRLSRISTSSRKSPPQRSLPPPAFPKRWFK
jgi:hypothetical protein